MGWVGQKWHKNWDHTSQKCPVQLVALLSNIHKQISFSTHNKKSKHGVGQTIDKRQKTGYKNGPRENKCWGLEVDTSRQ